MSAFRWFRNWNTAADDTAANPLAVGAFCDVCGTRLEANRPCPFGPHDEVAA